MILTSNQWENFMFNLVVVSSIMLIVDQPLADMNTDDQIIFLITDTSISVMFLVEAFLLMIVYGLWNDKRSGYFQDPFSWIDFFIAVLSILALQFDQLRIAKVFKPLRFIKKAKGLQVLLVVLCNR
jgi:hypothetical protein